MTLHRVLQGEDPVELGKRAHWIVDWVPINQTVYVQTKRFDWHPCTAREWDILFPGKNMLSIGGRLCERPT